MTRGAAVYLLVAGFLAGALLPIQAGVNARLRQTAGSPLQAALISFAVGTVGLGLLVAFSPEGWPRQFIARTPWWAWSGGLLGAIYVATALVLSPRVGALVLVALLVTGQLIAAIVLDHFGLLAYPQVPVTWMRVAGALLLLGGLFLVLPRKG